MNDLTIIYYTDNCLPQPLMERCQQELVRAAEGKRIISVSQKPLSFGDNICVGELGRSHHSLFTQTLTGVKEAKTKYVAMAEHDCMYHPGHFDWQPPRDDLFWYNINVWYAYTDTLSYTYYRRRPMSMLICTRELFIPAVEEKVLMLETGFELRPGDNGACEPGVCDDRPSFKEAYRKWHQQFKDVGKPYKAKGFATELPCLDIRWGGNYSRSRFRDNPRHADTLPYWGRFGDVLRGVSL